MSGGLVRGTPTMSIAGAPVAVPAEPAGLPAFGIKLNSPGVFHVLMAVNNGSELMQPATVATVAGCINSDPLFTAISTWNTPGLFNFIPKAGSPAGSAGTATGAPAIDIVGVPRTNPPD